MRKFVLYNADGEKYDLTDVRSFLQEPKNLGMERDNDYEQIGMQFVITEQKLKQKKPTGEICFEGYAEYLDFAKFIMRRPLVLEYTAEGTYRLDVDVTKLDKTELDYGGLYCQITMESLGTYYKAVTVRSTKERKGKEYSYRYPYSYQDFLSGRVVIDSDSEMDSPVKITLWGPCKNPSWAQEVNGDVVLRGKINAEIPAGRKLVIDTTKASYEIGEYDEENRLVADRYEDSDFSTERFVLLKRGRNTLVFSNEGLVEMKVAAEARILYETV